MKQYKKTRKAWEWARDIKSTGELKKVITRIERRKLKAEGQKEVDQYQDELLNDWEDLRDSFKVDDE